MTDAQLQFIYNVTSAILGAGAYVSVQLLKKIKPKEEQKEEKLTDEDQHAKDIGDAATGLVKTAAEVNQMLKDMLGEERIYFEKKINEAKADCQMQIDRIKQENKDTIRNLMADNEALKIRVSNLDLENEDLHNKINGLTDDKVQLQSDVNDLVERLSKYEADIKLKSSKKNGKR